MRKARNRAGPPIFRLGISPLDRFLQYDAVGGIFGGESVATILHAEHDKRLCAVVADAAATVGSNANYRAFLNGKNIAVNLKLAFAGEE